jgi:hypothetical protein
MSRRWKYSATWLPSAGRERCKLLKIADGCTIIYPLDGASLRSPREDAEASGRRLNYRNDPLGYASRPDLMRLLRFGSDQMQGLIVMLQPGSPAAASAASAW